MNPHLSIIIPAFNEENRIEKTLRSVLEFMERSGHTFEIVVVDDGSTDKTEVVLEKFPSVRVLKNETNQGKGAAVKRGMEGAAGEFKLFMDADGSTSIEELPKLLCLAEAGFPVVSSSRRAAGAKILVNRSPFRDFLSRGFGLLVSLLVPLPISDTQNGFKLFTKKAAEEVFKRQKITGWAFDVEILSIARVLGYQVAEVPIEWVNSGHSRMTAGGMFSMLLEVLRVRANLFLGRYTK